MWGLWCGVYDSGGSYCVDSGGVDDDGVDDDGVDDGGGSCCVDNGGVDGVGFIMAFVLVVLMKVVLMMWGLW